MISGVTSGSGLLYGDKNSIVVTVGVYVDHPLIMTRGSALVPQFLPASRPKPGVTCFYGFFQAFEVHICKHKHLARGFFLHYGGDQIRFNKILFKIHNTILNIPSHFNSLTQIKGSAVNSFSANSAVNIQIGKVDYIFQHGNAAARDYIAADLVSQIVKLL